MTEDFLLDNTQSDDLEKKSSTVINLKITSSSFGKSSDTRNTILEKISRLGFAKRFESLGEKIHQETFELLKEECQKLINEALTNDLQDPEEFKKMAVRDALKKVNDEFKKQLQELKDKQEIRVKEETGKLEDKLRDELEVQVREERFRGEKCLNKALEEAQEHFREHLKMSIQHVQEEQRKIGEENIRRMKKEFEDRLEGINQISSDDKRKCLSKLQQQLQKETDETYKQLKSEEEAGLKFELKKQREEYERNIKREEAKVEKLNKQMQQVAQQLKHTNYMKSLIDSEITKVRESLSQFVKLANKTETDPIYKAKVGEILKSANMDNYF